MCVFQVVFDKSKANAKYYGWDNEFGHKVVPVKEHRASKCVRVFLLLMNPRRTHTCVFGAWHA